MSARHAERPHETEPSFGEHEPMKPTETQGRPDPARTAGDCATAAFGPASEPRPRMPYRRPRLVTYGRLTDVTRFGGSQVVDSGPPGSLGEQL
jgi:hypothetical protein